jgi:hypothetical protein
VYGQTSPRYSSQIASPRRWASTSAAGEDSPSDGAARTLSWRYAGIGALIGAGAAIVMAMYAMIAAASTREQASSDVRRRGRQRVHTT